MSQATQRAETSYLSLNRICVTVILAAMIVVGCGWRLRGITEWPSRFHQTRQYDGALLARIFWLQMIADQLGEPERLWLNRQPKVIHEPPLTELLVALGYVMGGGERPWLGYLLATAFWLGGGRFVYDIARKLTGATSGGIVALAYYLLAPLGIILSRSFQPEAAMVFGFSLGLWWLLLRLDDVTNWRQTAVAGLVCGLAMLLKPGFAFFPLLAVYLVIRLQKLGPRRALREPQWFLFVGLLVLPSIIYAYFFLEGHAGQKFLPRLLFSPDYYRGLWMQVHATNGWYVAAASVAGAFLLAKRCGSYVGFALLLAYGVFCAVFSYHVITHSYYHAISVVIFSICLSPFGELCRHLKKWQIAVCLLVAVPAMLYHSAGAAQLVQRDPAFAERVRFYQQLGGVCGKGSVVVALDRHYGSPLRFHAWLITIPWPMSSDIAYNKLRGGDVETAEQRLDRLIQRRSPDFFVATGLGELNRQPELVKLLGQRYRKHAEGPSAAVFDLRQRRP